MLVARKHKLRRLCYYRWLDYFFIGLIELGAHFSANHVISNWFNHIYTFYCNFLTVYGYPVADIEEYYPKYFNTNAHDSIDIDEYNVIINHDHADMFVNVLPDPPVVNLTCFA